MSRPRLGRALLVAALSAPLLVTSASTPAGATDLGFTIDNFVVATPAGYTITCSAKWAEPNDLRTLVFVTAIDSCGMAGGVSAPGAAAYGWTVATAMAGVGPAPSREVCATASFDYVDYSVRPLPLLATKTISGCTTTYVGT